MNILDGFIVVVIAWGLWKGWKSGFFKELASLVGFVLGIFIASLLYSWLGDYLAPHLGNSPTLAAFLAFILLWIAVPVGLGILARMFSHAVEKTGLGGLNGLLGSCVSFVKYAILLSCLVNVMAFIHMIDDQKQRQESVFYAPTKAFVGWSFKYVMPSNNNKTDSKGVSDKMTHRYHAHG